jgi:DNA-binding SARP family transcriptional activator
MARDVVALLALRPSGVTAEEGMETLWPELDGDVSPFRYAACKARAVLRRATGRKDLGFISCRAGRYAIDPALVDSDLWQLEAALREASTADPAARRAALERAAELARRGELLARYEWAEAERECLRRKTTDALCSLSQARMDAGDAEGALSVLEDALRADDYAEDVYRRLIRLQLQLDRPDAARRARQDLERRLAQIDLDPEDETLQLFDEMVRLRRRGASARRVSDNGAMSNGVRPDQNGHGRGNHPLHTRRSLGADSGR